MKSVQDMGSLLRTSVNLEGEVPKETQIKQPSLLSTTGLQDASNTPPTESLNGDKIKLPSKNPEPLVSKLTQDKVGAGSKGAKLVGGDWLTKYGKAVETVGKDLGGGKDVKSLGTQFGSVGTFVGAPLVILDGVMSGIKLRDAIVGQKGLQEKIQQYNEKASAFNEKLEQYRDTNKAIVDLDKQISKLEKGEQTQEVTNQIQQLKSARDELKQEATVLQNEMRGLSKGTQEFAQTHKELFNAKLETAKSSVGVVKSTGDLAKLGVDSAKAGILLAGQTVSTGLTVASTVVSGVAGGVGIVAGGVTIGLESYKLHKATQQKEQIQQALDKVKDKTNDEVLDNVAQHAIAKKEDTRTLSKWAIFGGVLSVIAGAIAIAAIAATGVGAIVLAGAAIGVGLVAAGIAIGTYIHKAHQQKMDEALKDQVKGDALNDTLEAIKENIKNEYIDKGLEVPESMNLDVEAKNRLANQNKYFAVQLLKERLGEPDDSKDKQWALQFVTDSGMKEDEVLRLNLLATSSNPEDNKTAQTMLEKHFLG